MVAIISFIVRAWGVGLFGAVGLGGGFWMVEVGRLPLTFYGGTHKWLGIFVSR